MTETLGVLIRRIRQERGISLRQLASQMEIHFSHLSKVENGHDRLGRESVLRLADVLGLEEDLLLAAAGLQQQPFRVLGDVAAGSPIDAVEDVETFDLNRTFDPRDHFLLRVNGDSMIEDGIHDGDLAIIRRTDRARNGQTVVALVEGQEATLKRYELKGKCVRLSPANSRMRDQIYAAEQIRICGVFAGLIRTSASATGSTKR